MNKAINFTGRILMAQIFLMSGINKISSYSATQGYMEAVGIPVGLLPIVIAVEIIGALALIIGFKTRYAAVALAGFSVVSAMLFHADTGDQMQMIMFMKNVAMAGGLLAIASTEVRDTFSLDARRTELPI